MSANITGIFFQNLKRHFFHLTLKPSINNYEKPLNLIKQYAF
jgi:hypothetical protein